MRAGSKRAAVLIPFFFALLPIAAQDFQLTSFVDYYGGIEPSAGYENLRTRVFTRQRFSGISEDRGIEWVLSTNLWVQPEGEPYAIDPWDLLYEAYVFFPFNGFDLSIGQKIVAYGFADVYGPLNAAHSTNRAPLSLDDPFDSRRPDPLVQIRLYPNLEDIVEVTYVPFTRPDRERPGAVALPYTRDTVEWTDDPYLLDLPHSIFVNYAHYGEKFDLDLFYGWYAEQTPDFKVAVVDRTVPSAIEAVYRRKHTVGAAYSTRLGPTTFSQDFAVDITHDLGGEDIGGQNSDVIVNTQLLANLPFGILGQFSLVYAYFFNFDGYDPVADREAGEYLAEEIRNFHTQPYEHIAFIVSHLEKSFLREKLKTQLNTGFFFSPRVYLAPRLAYSLTDYWTVETGADITLGDPPDFDLRRNPSDDNFYVRLLYRY